MHIIPDDDDDDDDAYQSTHVQEQSLEQDSNAELQGPPPTAFDLNGPEPLTSIVTDEEDQFTIRDTSAELLSIHHRFGIQLRGKPTTKRYTYLTVFVDQYSHYGYEILQ
jgi:hypothetical protein